MESRAKLAARVAEIAPFHVMEVQTAARALEAAGRTVIHMEIGEPDFPTPAHVVEAANRALAAGATKYTAVTGTAELKAAVVEATKRPQYFNPLVSRRNEKDRGSLIGALSGYLVPDRK